jgi:hypothetical protein
MVTLLSTLRSNVWEKYNYRVLVLVPSSATKVTKYIFSIKTEIKSNFFQQMNDNKYAR